MGLLPFFDNTALGAPKPVPHGLSDGLFLWFHLNIIIMADDFSFPLGGGRTSPHSYGSNQREQNEIKLQVIGRSGADYNAVPVMFPSHLNKVAHLGTDDPTVKYSRQRLGSQLASDGCDWTEVKAKVQELYDRGKLAKWCATPEGAQAEIDKCWKYYNSAKLG